MNSQSPMECTVSGALAFALRISKAAGIAPLHFKKLRNGWRTRVSFAANVYGEVLAGSICAFNLVVFMTDFYISPTVSSDAKTRVRRAVYFMDLAVMPLVALTCTFTGSKRMKNMMIYMNQIHKINFELSSYGRTPSNDKKCWLFLALSTIGGILTTAVNFGVFMCIDIGYDGSVIIAIKHVLYFLLYTTMRIMQVQFALIVITALSPLKQLNGCLKNLLQEIDSQVKATHISQRKLMINNFIISDISKFSKKPPRDIHEAVHHLAVQHGSICDVVRQVDKSHGLILLVLLLSCLLYLITTLYFLINEFLLDAERFPSIMVIQILWFTFHISSLIIIVEPCHRTQEEMENTREIVSKMTQAVLSPDDPLSTELELFFRHLTLNRVTYSPLKMLTINRALLITMLSTITTYLVVVIQL